MATTKVNVSKISDFPKVTPAGTDYILVEKDGQGGSITLSQIPVSTPVNDKISEEVNKLNSQINDLAFLPEGSSVADAELINIRTPADGFTVPAGSNAGNAVRAQVTQLDEKISNLKGDLDNLENALLVDKTEDIYPSLSWTIGFMGKDGTIYSDSEAVLCYSNKIPVKSGDVLEISTDNAGSFRFVTAFNNDTALTELGDEVVNTYIVKEGTNFVVVTIYVNVKNPVIAKTHKVIMDVKTEVEELKTEVGKLKTEVEIAGAWTYGHFTSTELQYWNQTGNMVAYYKCKPNKLYKIKKTIGDKFNVAYVKYKPEKGITQTVYNYKEYQNNEDVEYYVGECGDDAYLLIYCAQYGYQESSGHTYAEVFSTIKVSTTEILIKDNEARAMVTYDDSFLPTEMYFVVNKEYEIYHNQICPNAENYTFKWTDGTNYGNRVRIKYDTTGIRTVTCTIYNADGTQAKILSVNINVVEKVTKDVYLLPFGDSLTNHCVWESELMNMAENIVCVGSRSRIIADSDGENRTVYNEGRAGFTSFNYTNGTSYADSLSDAGGDENPNRWYDPVNKKFSASYYFTNNFPSSQHIPTMFTFFLGMNDLTGSTSCNDISENIKSMINDIRSYMPDIPIVLIAPQIRYLSNLTGYEHVRFLEFSKTLENLSKEYTNMVFIPLCYGMDSLNNYNMRDITINTRSTITEKTAGDVTHPNKTGYWQIADMVLGAISYLA